MGVGGWGELYPSFFWIFFNFAKPLSLDNTSDKLTMKVTAGRDGWVGAWVREYMGFWCVGWWLGGLVGGWVGRCA